MDYSISVDGLDRPSIMVKLQLHHSQQSTAKLRQTLSKNLKKHHPIHSTLNKFDKIGIRNTAKIINVSIKKKSDNQLKAEIANYFFSTNPNSPLTALTELTSDLELTLHTADVNEYSDENTCSDENTYIHFLVALLQERNSQVVFCEGKNRATSYIVQLRCNGICASYQK